MNNIMERAADMIPSEVATGARRARINTDSLGQLLQFCKEDQNEYCQVVSRFCAICMCMPAYACMTASGRRGASRSGIKPRLRRQAVCFTQRASDAASMAPD